MPPDGAKYQPIDVDLSWSPGQGAVSHEVYFGMDKDAVANAEAAVFKGKQPTSTFEPGDLAMDTTYYWRIDETDAAGTKHVGQVWSFTITIPGLGAAKRELWNNVTGSTVATLTADTRFPGSPGRRRPRCRTLNRRRVSATTTAAGSPPGCTSRPRAITRSGSPAMTMAN